MIHQTADNLIPSCTYFWRLIQIFKGQITTVYFFSIHGVSHFGVGKSTTSKLLAQVSQIMVGSVLVHRWLGSAVPTCNGDGLGLNPPRVSGSRSVNRDSKVYLVHEMTSGYPWWVLSLFSWFLVPNIREEKTNQKIKLAAACLRASAPSSFPPHPCTPCSQASSVFFYWSELCNNPLRCTFEWDFVQNRNSPSRACCIPTVCEIRVRCLLDFDRNYKHLCTQKGVLNWGNLAWQIVSLFSNF